MAEWKVYGRNNTEKFEIFASTSRVILNCTSEPSDILSMRQRFWLEPDKARDLANALLAAADYMDRECSKESK